jgi:hypothetical protein
MYLQKPKVPKCAADFQLVGNGLGYEQLGILHPNLTV